MPQGVSGPVAGFAADSVRGSGWGNGLLSAWLIAIAMAASGCDCGGGGGTPDCTTPDDCSTGQVCLAGQCVPPPDGSVTDANVPRDGATRDAALGPACDEATPCQNDSHCVDGHCLPWTEDGFDPECARIIEPGPVRPQLQCVWSGPPAGDPTPTFVPVRHTPLVANLGITPGPDLPPRPSIVFISDYTYREDHSGGRRCSAAGTLRAIDGATCNEQVAATDVDDRVNASVTPAIGDLDGDGRPEIVAAKAEGGLIAFTYDPGRHALVRLWRSRTPDGGDDLQGEETCLWSGVSIYDLNDDGSPEIIFHGAVWDATGLRIATIPEWVHYPWGSPAVVADIDGDGIVELLAGEATWQWNDAARTFDVRTDFAGSTARGFSAIADFGDFPAVSGDAPGRPEVVVVGNGNIVVQSISGAEVAAIAPASGSGGPPTIADYDGDGVPEIGAAFADAYVVYDVVDRAVLWSQPSQDRSSARTGSSVFDFNADGRAEVVYGDECYVRVYDGMSGDVLFSQARYSSTWEENPIVADVDGDAAAEIVMGMSGPCNPGYCPVVDPIFAGLRCDLPGDCPSGVCDEGLCRCTGDDDCGDTYRCRDPLADTPGTGQVCRAAHEDCEPGLRVYRDARDRWAGSRQIWNQHAYHVTNVLENGVIPRTSDVVANWAAPGLNNFRQNVQGELGLDAGPDLTVGDLVAICEGAETRLTAQVCNRGTALNDAGVEIIFRQAGSDELCRLRTTEPVPPGVCTGVSCVAPVRAQGTFEAVVDPDGIITECHETNNGASGVASCLL